MTKKFNVIRTGGSVGEISNAMRYSSWDAKNGGLLKTKTKLKTLQKH